MSKAKSEFRRLAVQDPVGSAHQLAKVTVERDEARRQLAETQRRVAEVAWTHHADEWLAHCFHEVADDRDRLRDALRRARLDVTDVGASGWDSTRLERTKEAVARIDAALAESEETT